MVQLGATDSSAPVYPQERLRGGQHAERRRSEVDPETVTTGEERRGHGARRVHAHPGQRCLERNECGDQHSGRNAGESRQPLGVRHRQDGEHHHERDRCLGAEGPCRPRRPRHRRDEVHGSVGRESAEDERCDAHSGGSSQELRAHVSGGVDRGNLSEPEEGQRDSRVHVRPRAAARRRIDQGDAGQPHREAHRKTRQGRQGGPAGKRRAWVLEHHGEGDCRDHEDAKTAAFNRVLAPVPGRWGHAGGSMPLRGRGFNHDGSGRGL